MAFHVSNFGSFGGGLPRDINGYVPEEGDDWRNMSWELDHETSRDLRSEDPDRVATAEAYLDGEWWPEVVAQAVEATAKASAALDEWRAR